MLSTLNNNTKPVGVELPPVIGQTWPTGWDWRTDASAGHLNNYEGEEADELALQEGIKNGETGDVIWR